MILLVFVTLYMSSKTKLGKVYFTLNVFHAKVFWVKNSNSIQPAISENIGHIKLHNKVLNFLRVVINFSWNVDFFAILNHEEIEYGINITSVTKSVLYITKSIHCEVMELHCFHYKAVASYYSTFNFKFFMSAITNM